MVKSGTLEIMALHTAPFKDIRDTVPERSRDSGKHVVVTARQAVVDDSSDPEIYVPPIVTIGSESEWSNVLTSGGGKISWLVDDQDDTGCFMLAEGEKMEWEVNTHVPSLRYAPLYG